MVYTTVDGSACHAMPAPALLPVGVESYGAKKHDRVHAGGTQSSALTVKLIRIGGMARAKANTLAQGDNGDANCAT